MADTTIRNFWQLKTLEQMSTEEWESLCDGCGKCCLVKLEDYESGEIFHTNVTCELLNTESCRCMDYAGRHGIVDDCIQLDRENIESLDWLPSSCSYRLIAGASHCLSGIIWCQVVVKHSILLAPHYRAEWCQNYMYMTMTSKTILFNGLIRYVYGRKLFVGLGGLCGGRIVRAHSYVDFFQKMAIRSNSSPLVNYCQCDFIDAGNCLS